MKNVITLIIIIVFITAHCYSQCDTIFTNSETIACLVKEVTESAVKFAYPKEEIINTVYKNTIQKIVYRSGRVQTFAEMTSFKTVRGADDYENVTLTMVQSEVNGLFKLGEVSSKAKGTTVLSSMEKVKERANKKMKIVAAMMGANIVYLTQNNTTGNQAGSYFQASKSTETNLAGVAYSNKIPSYDEFVKMIGDKTLFSTLERATLSGSDADMGKNIFTKNLQVFRVYNESGLILLDARIDGYEFKTYRVVSFTHDEFILVYKDGDKIYNFKIRV